MCLVLVGRVGGEGAVGSKEGRKECVGVEGLKKKLR